MLCVFERYKDSYTNLLSLDGLRNALQHLDAIMDEQSLSDLFQEMDVNSDRGLDVDEFRMLVHKPSKSNNGLLLPPLQRQLLTQCLDALHTISKMCHNDIAVVCTATVVSDGLKTILLKEIQNLGQAFKFLDESQIDRQSTLSRFEFFSMAGGEAQDFYSGLGVHVGNWYFIAPSHPHAEVTKLLCPHHEGAC